MQSDNIAALAAALARAQGAIVGARKDSANPFFKSRYADLASVWEACRAPLAANELCVVQAIDIIGERPVLISTLAHSSGEWIKSITPVLSKDDSPQAFASALTYARRISLSALVGVSAIDDDGEAAQGRQSLPPPALDAQVLTQIEACATVADLNALYRKLDTSARSQHAAAFAARKKAL